MSADDPFLGQLMIGAFSFAPRKWALCNGQTLGIAQNQALFTLLGTAYGGDGQNTFALPNLNGRVPAGVGTAPGQPSSSAITLGQTGGEAQHTLQISEMPNHTHTMFVDAANPASGNSNTPTAGSALGQTTGTGSGGSFPVTIYNSTLTNQATTASQSIGSNGSSQGHENRQPYNTLAYCICLQGIYPSRP